MATAAKEVTVIGKEMSECIWQQGENNRDKQISETEKGTETERGFNDPSQEKEGIKRNNQQAEFISHNCK